MTACEACRNTTETGISFYKFPRDEEHLQQWIANMGKDEAWTPAESSALCSAHFTPECFDGSGHLHSYAIPTVFPPDQPVDLQVFKESENVTVQQETAETHSDTPARTCDCEERIQAIERAYRLKLLSAQLQIKKYQKELMEQSHKAMKWQKKALILKSAVITLKLRKAASTPAASEKPTDLVQD